MCGICGIVRIDGRPVDGRVLDPMLATLRRRGPDGEGTWVGQGVALGHRRLAVVDIVGGTQPMLTPDGKRAVVYNGEIYGFLRLREELETHGQRFLTRSDTEVLLLGHVQWGDSLVERLDGMFAFAIWDATARRLLLARDRFGEKPLFWTERDGALIFASTLSALLTHPDVDSSLDPAALASYLVLEHVPAPHSIIRGVRKIPPGGMLVFDAAGVHERCWYRSLVAVPRNWHPHDLDEELRRRLIQSARDRLVADVSVGVLLSGGIDSSSVAAAAVAAGASRIDTFTISMDRPGWDESRWAQQVAAHLGTCHHERRLCEADVLAVIPRLGEVLDEPIGDSSIVPTYLVSELASSHVKVVLGGDGGDELFGGYPTYLAHRWAARARRRLPVWAVSVLRRALGALPVSDAYMALDFRLKRWSHGLDAPPARRSWTWMAGVEPQNLPELAAFDFDDAALFAPVTDAWQENGHASDVDRAQAQDAAILLPLILAKVDRASMWHGLEVRAPLLARALVELAATLPEGERVGYFRGKVALRRAIWPWLPRGITLRGKHGFAMPIGAWLRGPLGDLASDLLLGSGGLAAAGWLHGAVIRRWLSEHRRGIIDHRKALWTLLVLELWRQSSARPTSA